MKICCVADLHGFFPEIPDCDILLMGGDYCPHSRRQCFWFQNHFKPYLQSIADRGITIVGVAGNHDWGFQREIEAMPRLPWIYLQDYGCEINGLKIWGSPWQTRYFDWAFNLDEIDLKDK